MRPVIKISTSEFLRRMARARAKESANGTVSLDDYRRDAMRTYPYELALNERRDYAAMKLGEEAAEFMAVVNKSHYQGEAYSRERVRDELGDVMWALMVNATEHGLSLDEIMLANMAKRRIKYPPEGV